MDDPKILAIRQVAEPILAERQLELVELVTHRQGRQWLIRLLVDAVGGVTIQRCAKANRLIADAIEAANLFEERFTVEVSSPGLDRPLVSRRDFERAIGQELKLELVGDDGRPTVVEGMVLAVQAEAIVVTIPAGNITIPLASIRLAKKAIHFRSQQ